VNQKKRNIVIWLLASLLILAVVFAYGISKKHSRKINPKEIDKDTISHITEVKETEAIAAKNPNERINQKLKTSKNYDLSFRDSLVAYGQTLLGTPYVYAGCSTKGFDCSGFVYFVFKHFGVDVPRSSKLYADFGTEVNIKHVQIGDVLVFKSPSSDAIGHVGIVTKANGMETEFIHSSSGKSMGVIISSLQQQGYKKRYIKAVDVLGDR
jgi:cell wall-associated NlpC family hydrolase